MRDRLAASRFLIPLVLLAALAALAALVGCSGDQSPDSLTAPRHSSGLGAVHVRMTSGDAPAGYDEVNIVVSEVQIRQAACNDISSGCWTVISDAEATYDLQDVSNGVFVTIALDPSVPAARYDEVMLVVGNGSNVVIDGASYPLQMADGQPQGVRIEADFEVKEEGRVEILLDFDAAASISRIRNRQYMLDPRIRMLQGDASRSISF